MDANWIFHNFAEVTSNCSVFKNVASLTMWFSRPFRSLNMIITAVPKLVGIPVESRSCGSYKNMISYFLGIASKPMYILAVIIRLY